MAHEKFNDTWRHDWLCREWNPWVDGTRGNPLAFGQGQPSHLCGWTDAKMVGSAMAELIEGSCPRGDGPGNH